VGAELAEYDGFTAIDGSKAIAAGQVERPLVETIADALAWERELGIDRPRRAGLDPDREWELLAGWRARSGR